jgi:energy coupling factor transporter S component ThiW
MKTKKLTYSALLAAVGIIAGNLIYFPIGASKCFPIQHLINVISAVILGPFYGTAIAFVISLIRNIMGTGTLLAFPGSMIGALLAGLVFKYTKKDYLAVAAEVIGTGVIGAILAYPVAVLILGRKAALFTYVVPFLVSTIGGSIIAFVILRALKMSKAFSKTLES